MEKKQLVIIPPMSEALKKLNEGLEGISLEENMEINIIDDLHELTQFLNNSGQCLILVSSAKKCINFLQDNKNTIAKTHTKTILCTQTELPSKVLAKLTKMGLTENILENSPPKTFVYKVRLLLKSIKTASKLAEEASQGSLNKVIKSTSEIAQKDDSGSIEKVAGQPTSLKLTEETPLTAVVNDTDLILDPVSTNAKVKYHENEISTHWGSVVDSKDLDIIETEDKVNKIKNKKLVEDASNEENDKNKSNKFHDDNDENGIIALKKSSTENTFELDDQDKEIKLKNAIELDIDHKKSNNTGKNQEEYEELKKRSKNKYAEENIDIGSESKRTNKETILDDIYSKKRKNQNVDESDNQSETLKRDKNDELNIDLDNGNQKKSKKSNDNNLPEDKNKFSNKNNANEYDNSELGKLKKSNHEIELQTDEDKQEFKQNKSLIDTESSEGDLNNSRPKLKDEYEKVRSMNKELTIKEDNQENSQFQSIQEDEHSRIRSFKEENNEIQEQKTLAPRLKLVKNKDKDEDDTGLEINKKMKDRDIDQNNIGPNGNIKNAENIISELELEKKNKNVEPMSEIEEKSKQKKQNDYDPEFANNLKLKKQNSISLELERSAKETTYQNNLDIIGGTNTHKEKKTRHSWDNLFEKSDIGQGIKNNSNAESNDSIDYRRLKKEFQNNSTSYRESNNEALISRKKNNELNVTEDEAPIIKLNPTGLDFAVNFINHIYQNDVTSRKLYQLIIEEIKSKFSGDTVIFKYSARSNDHQEVINSFFELRKENLLDTQEWWENWRKDSNNLNFFFKKNITTWICREIIKNDTHWEDVELPKWAEHELKDKKVELAFPYYDGIDRMGLAIIFFNNGIDTEKIDGVITVLEMARACLLDSLERKSIEDENESNVISKTKNNIFGFFNSLFGKKKSG